MSEADYRDIGCDVGRPEAVDVEEINPSSAIRELAKCGQNLSLILWVIMDMVEPDDDLAAHLCPFQSLQENWERALERIQASFIYNCDWDDYDWGTAQECVTEDRAHRNKLALLYPDKENNHE